MRCNSSLPDGVLGPTCESIGRFVDEAPAATFDGSVAAFAYERDGEPRLADSRRDVS